MAQILQSLRTRAPSSETNQLHEGRERVLIAQINADMVNTAVVLSILGGEKRKKLKERT